MKTSKSYIVLFLFFISFNTFSQIVLNELMIRPPGTIQTPPNGLIYNSSQEYIELYNSSCSPVNITGYFIAMKQALSGTNTGGTIKIPNVPAATIPPGGHIVIGSSNAGGAVLGNIDIPLVAADYCMYNGNFVLANTDGWCALYDASGVPLDCIYWSSSAGNLTANTSDFDPGVLCLPTGTPSTVVLKTPIQINAQFPGIVKYGGSNPASGSPISRQTDGSTVLVQNLPSSIAVNNCNGGTCVPQGTFSTLPTIVQPSCNTPNGIISFNPQPTGTYFYLWPFPTTGQTSSVNNLAAGSYSITITSASGCSKDTTIVLAASNGPTAVAVTETDPGCSLANGLVAIGNVTGGTAPYQYNFNAQGFSGAQNYSNLAAGSYSLIIRDANGCEFTAPTITLISPNGPTAVAVTETDPGCSLANGSIAIGNVTGGTSPYTYSFNGGAFSSTAVYNNLATGTYSLTVKDANGCEFVATTITLSSPNAPTAVNITETDPVCGQTNGAITIGTVTGGTAPYSYSLNGATFSSITNFTNLSAGNYTITVKDVNGCEFVAPTTTLTNPNAPTNIVYTSTNAKCDGTGGTLTVSNTTGGTAPYTYSFNGSAFTNTLNYTSINASIYSLIVKDANGCEFTESIIINANTPLSASFSATVQSGGNDTLTEVTASSGYNNSYVWNYSSQNEVLNASFINISSTGIGVTYNWIFNNGQTTDTITNNLNNLLQNIQGPNSLNVTLIVTNGDATCNDTAKILIEIKSSLIIPNIFSPNGDGINDVFLIKYKGYKELQLSVFNRWGNKYYETTKPEEGWNGDKAAEGTYFYVITGKGNDEKAFEAKGYFMLVR
jgi:gliding motility-associated-like protein